MSTALPPTEITAGRLHLRPWQPADADAVHAARQDPELQRWTRVPVPYRRADAVAHVEQVGPQAWSAGTAAHLAVLGGVTTGSRRVAEKAGFVVEGTLRQHLPHRGERPDAWIGGLLLGDAGR